MPGTQPESPPHRGAGRRSVAGGSAAADAAPPTSRRRTITAALMTATGVLAVALAARWWLVRERTTSGALDNARFQQVTDFGGTEQGAAISADGKLVAFLSDRDGPMDVWLTQLGAGQFYNLTRGRFEARQTPSLRMLGFSPDASLVTFWARGVDGSNSRRDQRLGRADSAAGEARSYLEGVAEFAWSGDGSRVVPHPGAGRPHVCEGRGTNLRGPANLSAAARLHAHFPLWSQSGTSSTSCRECRPTRWTSAREPGRWIRRAAHLSRLAGEPSVLLNDRTLMYLAGGKTAPSDPWLYSLDVQRRPHRVAGSRSVYLARGGADGHHLVAAQESEEHTLATGARR